ncbi:VWA domain-containing protein [Mycobacterium sp. Marseille-P9652]|uniref:VWA domain-containing protein n=1 Tax=Mycobacterium sp. Marseille-P9652 TaxID=2654950 RepID=UPI0012E8FCAE|nr:VWA domain-containing protein [Mycobacterium sp. Marseille-P9652]
MTAYPVLPAIWIVVLGAVLVTIRIVALYRLLLRTPAGRLRRVVLRWSAMTFAVILLLIAACRPGFDADPAGASADAPKADTNVNVFFVVDRSVNSRVEDFGDGASRMSGMRADMGALIDSYPHARFALISFAANATLDWPLSDDAWSLQSFVKGLSPYTVAPPDAVYRANPVAARDLLRDKVGEAATVFPGAQTFVFYFGEGAPGSRAPAAPIDLGRAKIAGGAVLGYGTPAGGPVPEGWVDGRKRYQAGPGGGPLTSAIDEGRLQGIAAQLDVPYFHRESGQPISGIAPAPNRSANVEGERDRQSTVFIGRLELYWVFALAAAALLLVEVVLTAREYRRNRMSTRDVGR